MKRIYSILMSVLFIYPAFTQTRQVFQGHIPELVKQLKPLGRLDKKTILDITIGLPLRNQEEMMARLRDMYDTKSKNFRHFLTPAEFTRLYGPEKKDFELLIAFARKNKFKIMNAPENRALLQVQLPAMVAERLFAVELFRFENPITHKPFYSITKEPSIDITTPILHIGGLENLADSYTRGGATNRVGSGSGGNYQGNDFRNAYAPDVPMLGEGQTIGLLAFSDYSDADIAAYESGAGLPNAIVNRIFLDIPRFITPPPPVIGAFDPELEISMDIEMAISMAPAAKINVYGINGSGSTASGLNEIVSPTKGESFPNQIGCSVSLNYGGTDPTILKLFLQMAMQGQTFFGWSGDNGAYADSYPGMGPWPFPPGDYIYVTSVGGTLLSMNGNGTSYNSEMAWGGSGGGPSPWFKIESWQFAAVAGTNSANKSMRNCPDVSMPASGIWIVANGGIGQVSGGTSASTPLWAGFMALVNEKAAQSGFPPVGFLNPSLYEIGASPSYTNCFHDVTTGTNTSTGVASKYSATKGYDLATGWGSPKGLTLINALALRKPDIFDATLSFQSTDLSGCQHGPVAGTIGSYHVKINSGTGPYTYTWTPTSTTILSGNGTSTVIVQIPPTGTKAELSVSITDANGSHLVASTDVFGLDPKVAGWLERTCLIGHDLIYTYISPNLPFRGDPVPFWDLQRALTAAELRTISDQLKQMQIVVNSMQEDANH